MEAGVVEMEAAVELRAGWGTPSSRGLAAGRRQRTEGPAPDVAAAAAAAVDSQDWELGQLAAAVAEGDTAAVALHRSGSSSSRMRTLLNTA